jgi:hypothetical protein
MPSRLPAEPRPAEDGQPEFRVRPATESGVQLAGTGLVASDLTSGCTVTGPGTSVLNLPGYLVTSARIEYGPVLAGLISEYRRQAGQHRDIR